MEFKKYKEKGHAKTMIHGSFHDILKFFIYIIKIKFGTNAKYTEEKDEICIIFNGFLPIEYDLDRRSK